MSEDKSKELRVSVDVGYRRHRMAIGLPSGEVLEEFEIEHRLEGFRDFFPRIEKHNPKQGYSVAVRISCSSGVDVPFTCRCWTAAKPCLSAFWLPGGPDLPRMPAMPEE